MSAKDTAQVYERAGWGNRVVRGSRPAVLVVDLSRGFTEPEFPTGADLSEVVESTSRLVDAAHSAGAPVIFTTIAYEEADLVGGCAWLRKAPGMGTLRAGSESVDLDPRLPREANDALVVKKGPSAFFGTDVAASFVAHGVDTVLVCGATTSGCVRASVVDAVQYGFTVLVPRPCVGDRAAGPHEANLFDIDAKYGDVIDLDDALAYVAAPRGGRPVKVVLLPGDGIGPEVVAEAAKALAAAAPAVETSEHPIGSAAIARDGEALPAATLAACEAADGVLLGAVGSGDYSWSATNPEDGMFRLRQALDVYANVRPFRAGEIDLLIVRELVGGLYFGERGTRADGTVFDTCEYRPDQVDRVLRRGFELASSRRGRLTSVDKANVLATSRLWRERAIALAADYPEVELDHLLVDTAAMRLVQAPESFDVIVTENTFGDILSDIAAALAGGLGVAASASLGDGGPGLFEPVHGTAPDIAGKGVANPTAAIRSVAMLLEHGLGMPDEAARLDAALDRVATTISTPDQGGSATTAEFGDAVVTALAADSDPELADA